jgi:TolB-like protein/tetratricopeptide (TPR) repeat protein/class 3 adenylate cyclase
MLRLNPSSLEIAHVLFMDLVSYSLMPTDVQSRTVETLQSLVRATPEFQKASTANRLISLPTGDGMALVFFDDPRSPVQCAVEIAEALKQHPDLKLRMGVHSGPVYRVADINTNANVAGGGINISQRVMDFGDAGHILVSKTLADTLVQLSDWGKYLIDLGTHAVKHSVPVHIFNLYTGTVGNPRKPSKLSAKRKQGVERVAIVAAVIVGMLAAGGFAFYRWWTHRDVFDSLAVMPMANTSGNPEVDFRSEAMTENLINTLGKLPNLRVISRSAVLRYRNKPDLDPEAVGRDLKVAAILMGSVSEQKDHLIVRAELVDARNSNHLWGQPYDRLATDFSAIQEDIGREVTSRLRLTLTPEGERLLARRYTNDPEAEKLYQKGRFFWNRRSQEGLRNAIDYFQQAIQQDPGYALAYAGLADAYSLRSSSVAPKQVFQLAENAALKAVMKDGSLAEAHAALAFIKLHYDWDWVETEKEYKRAIELNPKYGSAHSMYAVYLMVRGRFEESFQEMTRAQKLDPISIPIATAPARPLYLAGKYEEAIDVYRKALEMDQNSLPARYGLGLVYEQQGKIHEALAEYLKGPLFPDDAGAISTQGHAYALAGDNAKVAIALQKLKQMAQKRYVSPCEIATVYAGMGDRERMFENLDQCYNQRAWEIIFLNVDPVFKSYRNDPRFLTIVKNLKLP